MMNMSDLSNDDSFHINDNMEEEDDEENVKTEKDEMHP